MPDRTSMPAPHARRREVGAASRAATRRRLLLAADELFLSQGYANVTVSAIAARAGVSLQTLYSAWGSKRELLRAARVAAVTDTTLPPAAELWRATVQTQLEDLAGKQGTAGEYLGAVSRVFVQVARRAAPYWRLYQQAAVSDPELAADQNTANLARRQTLTEVARNMPIRHLRPEISAEQLAETLCILASPELYDLFTMQAGHSAEEFEVWLTRTLTHTLCTDA